MTPRLQSRHSRPPPPGTLRVTLGTTVRTPSRTVIELPVDAQVLGASRPDAVVRGHEILVVTGRQFLSAIRHPWRSLPRCDELSRMEKFTKFRDPGTGIAPFPPIAAGSRTPLTFPLELTVCVIRLPLLCLVFGLHIVLVEGLGELALRTTVPNLLGWMKWAFLRTILFFCGIWYIDEQLDGVSKAQRNLAVKPKRGNLVVSNFTSPLDIVYFAAKYDAAFVCSFDSCGKVEPTPFLTALWRSIRPPQLEPSPKAKLYAIDDLPRSLSIRIVVVFPETTPTNGRAILAVSPAISPNLPSSMIVYAANVKYSPPDITLPTPAGWALVWRATSFVKHGMRVRITHRPLIRGADLHEALAKTGRLKFVGLGAKEKLEFLDAWKRKRT